MYIAHELGVLRYMYPERARKITKASWRTIGYGGWEREFKAQRSLWVRTLS